MRTSWLSLAVSPRPEGPRDTSGAREGRAGFPSRSRPLPKGRSWARLGSPSPRARFRCRNRDRDESFDLEFTGLNQRPPSQTWIRRPLPEKRGSQSQPEHDLTTRPPIATTRKRLQRRIERRSPLGAQGLDGNPKLSAPRPRRIATPGTPKSQQARRSGAETFELQDLSAPPPRRVLTLRAPKSCRAFCSANLEPHPGAPPTRRPKSHRNATLDPR